MQVGPPKNIDLQAVQLEDKNIEKPEGSQFEKQSVKSENVQSQQEEEFVQAMKKF